MSIQPGHGVLNNYVSHLRISFCQVLIPKFSRNIIFAVFANKLTRFFCCWSATSVMTCLKKQLAEIERALEGKVTVVLATQHLNHMYSVTADKNPVCALEIEYTLFFQWKQIKELKTQLSYPVPLFCQLLNSSIQQGSYSINECSGRLESRLKKGYSRVLSKYKPLKG